MMEEANPLEPAPIPEIFHSFETGSPFTLCLECRSDLMTGQPYLIEKAFKNHIEFQVKDTVYDYALCMNCAEQIKNEMSKESVASIMQFFAERLNPAEHISRMHLSPLQNIETCMITGKKMDECPEYQIYAYCVNNTISAEMPPYMVSGEVMEDILPILSKKTKDDLDGFFNKHFAPDPSLMEPVGPKFVLI